MINNDYNSQSRRPEMIKRAAIRLRIPFPGYNKDNIKVKLSDDKKNIIISAIQRNGTADSYLEKIRRETIPTPTEPDIDLQAMSYNFDEELGVINIDIPQSPHVTFFQSTYQNPPEVKLTLKDNRLHIEVYQPGFKQVHVNLFIYTI